MRTIEEVLIHDVESFLQEMVPSLGFQRNPVYRGQASADWSLLPPLHREEVSRTEFSSWTDLEAALLIRWKQLSRGELGYEPTSELEWMSLAQSHGVPTRLSAWTENALVALYFATEEHGDEDGVVWRILPGNTSLVISQDYEQVPEQARIYLPQKVDAAAMNQKTCFLSHPLPPENASPKAFEEIFKRGSERMHLARLVVPASEKSFMRRRLATMGIDRRALFPGLAGIGSQIREEIYSHTDSYEWVFPE